MIIDLTEQLNLAQIAFGITVIAVAITYYVFAKKPTKSDHKGKK